MSNCIALHDATIQLSDRDIKIEELKALINRVKDLKEAPSGTADGPGYIAWWFLCQTEFLDERHVEITLGAGRSIHTWRDFGATMRVIETFAKRPFNVTVKVRDTDDNRPWSKGTWRVAPGEGGDWIK